MEETLLPCPFCGSSDVSERLEGRFVRCMNCSTEGPYNCPPENWNKRATLDENAQEAGTMRMLREMAQEMGYADTLEALEVLARVDRLMKGKFGYEAGSREWCAACDDMDAKEEENDAIPF